MAVKNFCTKVIVASLQSGDDGLLLLNTIGEIDRHWWFLGIDCNPPGGDIPALHRAGGAQSAKCNGER